MRRHYLVTYDIADDKRRTKVFRTLRDNGNHTQYSVFLCELSNAELVVLKTILTEIINNKEDQILILDLGKAERDILTTLSTIGQRYQPPSTSFII